jgi:ribosome-associated protein
MTGKKSGEDNQADVRIVEISREPVELYKILKFEGMASSGGQAKAVIAEGQVLVNEKTETQKRKKIVTGDTIEFNREKIKVQFVAADVSTAPDPSIDPDPSIAQDAGKG